MQFDRRDNGKERLAVRFGGDEMMIIACGVPMSQFTEEINRCSEEMRKTCYFTNEIHFNFDFTIGIASTEELAEDWTWDQLVSLADQRMYATKNDKRQKRR